MRCRKSKKLLALFAGGDLPRSKIPVLLAHLEVCQNCTSELEALQSTHALVGKIALEDIPEPLPTDFYWNLNRRIVQEKEKKTSLLRKWLDVLRWKPALSLGGAALVLLVAFGVLLHNIEYIEQPIVSINEESLNRATNELSDEELDARYPTVESITVPEEGTLMTFKLEDTNITIVWIF